MISRRTLIGAMAALPGAAALQQATAASEASSLVPDLARAPASPAALAYFEGDGATVARVETPPPSNLDAKIVRLHKLHREASQLMDAYNERVGGRWELRVRAADDAYPVTFTNLSQSVQADLARYHLEEYKRAAQAADPTITGWRRCTPEDDGDVAFWIYALRS